MYITLIPTVVRFWQPYMSSSFKFSLRLFETLDVI